MQDAASIFFWVSIAVLCYIYVGYPLLLWVLAWVFRIRLPSYAEDTPKVSVLMAAHNERESLPKKLASLRNQSYPEEKIQILIASDFSTDGTDSYLAEQSDVEWIAISTQSGKNHALNQLLPLAKGEVLFFTDANTILHQDAIARAARHYAHPKVGIVAGELIYTQDPHWNAVEQGTGIYWKYENGIKRLESRLGSVLVVSGALFSARKQVVDFLDPQIANDLEIPMKSAALGLYVLYDPQCLGFEKPHGTPEEEWRRTSRIVARGMNGFLRLFPLMIKTPFRLWQFISHKFLRWFTLPIGIVALCVSWFAEPAGITLPVFWMGVTALGLSLIGLGVIHKPNPPRWLKPVTLLTHLLLMFSAAAYGVFKGMTGNSPAVWKRPESTRKSI